MLKHESKVQTSECNLLPRQTSTVSGQNENRTILLVMKKKNHSIHLYTSAWERGGASVLQLTKIIIVMNKKEKKIHLPMLLVLKEAEILLSNLASANTHYMTLFNFYKMTFSSSCSKI